MDNSINITLAHLAMQWQGEDLLDNPFGDIQ